MSTAQEPAIETGVAKITVTVVYNGIAEQFTWPASTATRAALEQAMNTFGVTGQRHLMAFFREDESEIAHENSSLAENNVSTGTLLALKPSKVKGGAAWRR